MIREPANKPLQWHLKSIVSKAIGAVVGAYIRLSTLALFNDLVFIVSIRSIVIVVYFDNYQL